MEDLDEESHGQNEEDSSRQESGESAEAIQTTALIHETF